VAYIDSFDSWVVILHYITEWDGVAGSRVNLLSGDGNYCNVRGEAEN